jgi:hypothetical protein
MTPMPVTTTRLWGETVSIVWKGGKKKAPYRSGQARRQNASIAAQLLGSSLLLNVADDVANGLEFLRVGLGNLTFDFVLKFFLESHDQLDRIEGISAQVVEERRFVSYLFLVNIQLVNNDLLDALFDGFLVGHELKEVEGKYPK